ncbi:hypothetical protein N9B31_04815 [Mariniblastus sp.]|nr:hypothetical protein [Mariniblastus sp.]
MTNYSTMTSQLPRDSREETEVSTREVDGLLENSQEVWQVTWTLTTSGPRTAGHIRRSRNRHRLHYSLARFIGAIAAAGLKRRRH